MKTILDDALIVVNCDKNDIRKNLSMLIDEKGIIENIDGKDILKQANPTAKTISLKGKFYSQALLIAIRTLLQH